VVYLGYGGWESSRYVDITGKSVDFMFSDGTKHVIPKCDLLIIKDLIVPWGGEKYAEFFSHKIPATYIMDGQGIFKQS
jgi:hypothetical protein